jgi:hypothetical protein
MAATLANPATNNRRPALDAGLGFFASQNGQSIFG